MFKSPLVLPITLIFAGVLAFLATTGILPAELLRFWPVVFVVLGLIGLVSLSSDDLMADISAPVKKTASKAKAPVKAAPAATATKKAKSTPTKKSSKKTKSARRK